MERVMGIDESAGQPIRTSAASPLGEGHGWPEYRSAGGPIDMSEASPLGEGHGWPE